MLYRFTGYVLFAAQSGRKHIASHNARHLSRGAVERTTFQRAWQAKRVGWPDRGAGGLLGDGELDGRWLARAWRREDIICCW